jgi:hypothetical protein
LRIDRQNLRAALRDAKSGRAKHLPRREQQHFIEVVQRRIAAIEANLRAEPEVERQLSLSVLLARNDRFPP